MAAARAKGLYRMEGKDTRRRWRRAAVQVQRLAVQQVRLAPLDELLLPGLPRRLELHDRRLRLHLAAQRGAPARMSIGILSNSSSYGGSRQSNRSGAVPKNSRIATRPRSPAGTRACRARGSGSRRRSSSRASGTSARSACPGSARRAARRGSFGRQTARRLPTARQSARTAWSSHALPTASSLRPAPCPDRRSRCRASARWGTASSTAVRVVPVHLARPAFHRHDLEVGANPLVEVQRQLRDRHAVPHRHPELPDEPLESRLERRPFDAQARRWGWAGRTRSPGLPARAAARMQLAIV